MKTEVQERNCPLPYNQPINNKKHRSIFLIFFLSVKSISGNYEFHPLHLVRPKCMNHEPSSIKITNVAKERK